MWKPLRKSKYETSGSIFSDTFQISTTARKDAYNVEKFFPDYQLMCI